jgi:hypothetical protein
MKQIIRSCSRMDRGPHQQFRGRSKIVRCSKTWYDPHFVLSMMVSKIFQHYLLDRKF